MHHLPRIFALKKQHKSMDESLSSKPKSKSMELSQSPRKLVRRNAAKNFNFTPSESSSTSPSTSGSSAPRTRSLDMGSYRIQGKDGEVDLIFQSLGFNGPEDFEIPIADYELMKNKSSPSVIQRPKKAHVDLVEPEAKQQEANRFVVAAPHRFGNSVRTNVVADPDSVGRNLKQDAIPPLKIVNVPGTVGKGGGIKGDRPPLLMPPPPMTIPPLGDDCCSTWDLLERLAPDGDRSPSRCRAHYDDDDDDAEDAETDGESAFTEGTNGARVGETVILSGSCSFTTSNDDDSSSTTTDPVSIISPNSGCRINITQWVRGMILGRGSFGTVYEGMSSEGIFFAVKEVSLLEQGSQGKQSVYQLEQEIELLSQFEHENIVRYLGTEKADSKLYIFLELVTQGSLASLYGKYQLRDSHVSAYTRQILMGLSYLHERNVVHRDIKCANILVASDGTVKLADFGLAKATRLNDLMSCKGTAFWMAPEVIYRKSQGYGLAADIWSLGCTVLEMLTRHIPYHPYESQQALFRIVKGELPPIPDTLSYDARDFILQCLRVNADDRPTAAELLEHQFVQRPLYVPFGSESPMVPRR